MKFNYAFIALALPAFVAAHPRPGPSKTLSSGAPSATSTCSTGPIQCCDSVESARSGPISELLKLLGIVLEDLDIDIGTSCSPISVLGLGGGSCSANTVCCEDNSHGNLISLGCVPITL